MASLDDFSIPQTILRYFDLTASSYTDSHARQVGEKRRTYPEGKLFVDQLLDLAGIDGASLYPPTSPAGLRRLIHTIRSAQIDRLKQDCFIYYLLLDSDNASAATLPNGNGHHSENEGMNGGPSLDLVSTRLDKGKGKAKDADIAQAKEFARRRCLPQVWQGFMYGYWALDQGLWQEAIEALSNPAITSLNFLPSIFTVLATHVSPPPLALSLLHTLFTALSPPLHSDMLIALRAISLASASSLSDSFNSIRSLDHELHRQFREAVFLWALGAPIHPCGAGAPAVQASVLTQLLHLALQDEESAHLIDFLTHPPRSLSPTALDLLHELVTVRLIHQGQYAECLALDKELAGSGAGKEEDRQNRRERVKEFIGILPAAQRRVLELDGEISREEDRVRRHEPNGDVEMDVPRAGPSIPNGTNGTGNIIAPRPVRLPALLSLTGDPSSARPSSPAQRRFTPTPRNVSSPFAGPPQFARTDSPNGAPGTPSRNVSVQRLASGSPFAPPASVSARNVEVPRPVRRIINDDEEEGEGSGTPRNGHGGLERSLHQRQISGRSFASSVNLSKAAESAAPEEEAEPEEEVEMDEAAPEDSAKEAVQRPGSPVQMPPPPVPQPQAQKPTSRKSSRQIVTAKEASPSRSDIASKDASPPAITVSSRSTRRQTTAPPPENTSQENAKANGAKEEDDTISETSDLPIPGAYTTRRAHTREPSVSAPASRSRLTRSASRAVLDEGNADPGPPAKRTRTRTAPTDRKKAASPAPSDVGETPKRNSRRATREPSVASSAGGARRGGKSVTPGPRAGSPTGSVVSTRSRAGAREGSMTPRVTRTRK